MYQLVHHCLSCRLVQAYQGPAALGIWVDKEQEFGIIHLVMLAVWVKTVLGSLLGLFCRYFPAIAHQGVVYRNRGGPSMDVVPLDPGHVAVVSGDADSIVLQAVTSGYE